MANLPSRESPGTPLQEKRDPVVRGVWGRTRAAGSIAACGAMPGARAFGAGMPVIPRMTGAVAIRSGRRRSSTTGSAR